MKDSYTLEYLAELAKRQQNRKGYRGWFEVLNAGNVPHNVEMFNKMSGAGTSGTPESLTGSCGAGNSQSSAGAGTMTEQLADVDFKNKLENLELGDVITLRDPDNAEFPYLRITKNAKHPNLYKVWNESPDGYMANEVNLSTLKSTLYRISHCVELMESYMNTKSNETVELEYPEITVEVVTRYGNPTGYFSRSYGNWLPDYNDTKEIEVPYTYEVDKNSVVEVIGDLLNDEPALAGMEDDEFFGFIEEHLDDLVERFQEELLDYFREAATEEAQEQDWEDWLYEDYNKPNPYIFKDLQEAAESEVSLKDYWEDLPPVEEESFEPISTELELEGIDADDPVVEGCKYEWTELDPDNYSTGWNLVGSKDVFDADGFITTYNWYESVNEDCYIFNFEGDPIDIAHADHICDTREEAADWFNGYNGFEDADSALDEIPTLDVPTQAEDLEYDDGNNLPSKKPLLAEGAMSELDIDIQNSGGREAVILDLEKDLAALDSEISFLEDAVTVEVDPDSVFASREVIDRALESARKDRELILAKLRVLRG